MIPDVDRNDILEAVAQRDEGALRSLYRSYAGVMRALARHIGSWGRLNGRDSLAEAVQDVFVAFWEAAPSFDRSRSDPDTWLATLGHRLLVQRSRDLRHFSRQRAAATVPRSSASDSGIPGTGIPAAAILAVVRSGSPVHIRLAGLDDDTRYLLTNAFLGGSTVEELAKLSGRTPRQVTLTLIRAVEWLRRSGAVPAEGTGPSPGEPSNLDVGPGTAVEPGAPVSSVEGSIDDAALVDYAFGTVARERTAEIEIFLGEHPAVGNRVRLYQDALAGLVMALEDLPAASETQNHTSEEDLVARLRAHRRPPLPPRASRQSYVRRNQAWVGLGMAAALGLTVWLALGPLRTDRVERRIERYQERPGTLSTQLQDRDGDEFGTLLRLRNGRLFVAFEERPAGAAIYQVWELRGERIRSLGTPKGRTLLTAPVAAGAIVAITLEPSGGSPEPTGEPLVELRL